MTEKKPKAQPVQGSRATSAKSGDLGTQIHRARWLHLKGTPPKMKSRPLSRISEVASSRARDLSAELIGAAEALEASSLTDAESTELISRIDRVWLALAPMGKERGAVLILMSHIQSIRRLFNVA